MRTPEENAVIAVIRCLGFVGNAHYCPWCLNHFHEDRGQHQLDCEGLAIMREEDDDEWWNWKDYV